MWPGALARSRKLLPVGLPLLGTAAAGGRLSTTPHLFLSSPASSASSQPPPARPLHPLQAVVAVAALIGSSRDLVVSWSEGFTLFQ